MVELSHDARFTNVIFNSNIIWSLDLPGCRTVIMVDIIILHPIQRFCRYSQLIMTHYEVVEKVQCIVVFAVNSVS